MQDISNFSEIPSASRGTKRVYASPLPTHEEDVQYYNDDYDNYDYDNQGPEGLLQRSSICGLSGDDPSAQYLDSVLAPQPAPSSDEDSKVLESYKLDRAFLAVLAEPSDSPFALQCFQSLLGHLKGRSVYWAPNVNRFCDALSALGLGFYAAKQELEGEGVPLAFCRAVFSPDCHSVSPLSRGIGRALCVATRAIIATKGACYSEEDLKCLLNLCCVLMAELSLYCETACRQLLQRCIVQLMERFQYSASDMVFAMSVTGLDHEHMMTVLIGMIEVADTGLAHGTTNGAFECGSSEEMEISTAADSALPRITNLPMRQLIKVLEVRALLAIRMTGYLCYIETDESLSRVEYDCGFLDKNRGTGSKGATSMPRDLVIAICTSFVRRVRNPSLHVNPELYCFMCFSSYCAALPRVNRKRRAHDPEAAKAFMAVLDPIRQIASERWDEPLLENRIISDFSIAGYC